MKSIKWNKSIKFYEDILKYYKNSLIKPHIVRRFSNLFTSFEVEDEELKVTEEIEKIKKEHKKKIESNKIIINNSLT